MEGINYELISHPATATLQEIAQNLTAWIRQSISADENDESASLCAPNSFSFYGKALGGVKANDILVHFKELEKRALMFTDASFLYSPSTVGLAIAAVALGSYDEQRRLGELVQDYLVTRFPLKSETELIELYREVNRVIELLIDNPLMGICAMPVNGPGGETQSTIMQLALIKAEQLRISSPTQSTHPVQQNMPLYKRKASSMPLQESIEVGVADRRYHKLAKITP